jgi:hypothetical protein
MNDTFDDEQEPLFVSFEELQATQARLLAKGIIIPTGTFSRNSATGEIAPVYTINRALSAAEVEARLAEPLPPAPDE